MKRKMKRILLPIIIFTLSVSILSACGNNSSNEQSKSSNENEEKVEVEEKKEEPVEKKPEPVQLTLDNIDDYISIRGEYKNGEWHTSEAYAWSNDVSTADLDFQAYSTVAGSFNNVEITVRADLSAHEWGTKEKWHIDGSDDDSKVEFSFKMPASGEYSSTYKIKIYDNYGELEGSSILEIVSVSGTFTPED